MIFDEKTMSTYLFSEAQSSEKEAASCEAGPSGEGSADGEVPKPKR